MTAPLYGSHRHTDEMPVMQRAGVRFFRRMALVGVAIFGGVGERVYFLRDSISALLKFAATSASGRWVVTGTVRSVGPASIITTFPGETPHRSATNSVWPGCEKPIA